MNQINRRRWKRFTVDGAFVVTTRPSFFKIGRPVHTRLGPIKDIGMGGLAVQYMEKKMPDKKISGLAVMMPSEGIMVDPIPFEAVNNFEVTTLPHSNKKVWTLCVSFKKLMPRQKTQLEKFIADYGFEVVGP
ncbi:MAG: hypothetical protein R6U29_07610 [Desulfosudaceae bacterium]